MLPIYCDIDGTLTDAPAARWGNPNTRLIEALQELIANGRSVVLWSAGGAEYAQAFAERYKIAAIACLGKPQIIIDDIPTLRSPGLIIQTSPEGFLEMFEMGSSALLTFSAEAPSVGCTDGK